MAIYFDNAATTKIDPTVAEAMMPYLNGCFGNPSAIHSMGRPMRAEIEKARKTIASCINASPSEIFFTSGGTEANNTALLGAVRDLGVKHIITSNIEHHCILHFADFLDKNHDVNIHKLAVNNLGRIEYADLENKLTELDALGEKTLVCLMHANNEIGTMIDLDKVCEICKKHNALFHSDTVQTFAHFPLDLQKTPMDFISCSAHKFHGPKGIGFLYIKGDHKISPLLYGGAQERNMRAGTENILGIVGLGKATEIAFAHLDKDTEYVSGLKNYLKTQLLENLKDIQFNGDYDGESLYTVLNVSFPISPDRMLLLNLDVSGICASGGSACSSGTDIGSHVLNAIGADPNRTSIRFSFSKFSKKEEIDVLMAKLKEILG